MDRARKSELRSLNARAWNGDKDVFEVSSALDTSLKRHTAFTKRLRTAISPTTLNSFLHDIKTLKLEKYVPEAVHACHDGLCKLKAPADVDAGVEVVSAMHQRVGPRDFTEPLAFLLGRSMSTPDKGYLKSLTADQRDKEEKERLARQRILLRVVTELWLVDVLRTVEDVAPPASSGAEPIKPSASKSDTKARAGNRVVKAEGADPFPLAILKDLADMDRDHASLPLVVIFVKAFSWDILGVKAGRAEGRKVVEGDQQDLEVSMSSTDGNEDDASQSPEDQPITPPALQERFRNVLALYFDSVKKHLVRQQETISAQARRNAEAYVKSGEVFEDRQANFDKQVKAHERLISNAQIIADVIGDELPDLREADASNSAASGGISLVKLGELGNADGAGIWEDEEERAFYENLVDLKGKVPGMLLEEPKKKKTDSDEQVGRRLDSVDIAEAAKKQENPDDQSMAIANKTVGAQVDTLLGRLPDLMTSEAVDQLALDFCFLNSKASRNRLIKALTEVPKGRSDLYKPWSRLVATLGAYMSDVPKGVVDYLDTEFRSLQRRKEKEFLGQVRLGNVRYLAELTKFGVVPEHVVFHCLKVALDDFSRMNIEIICNLLENCGRYLLRNAETSPRMASFLETLQRKKSVQHIGQQERMLIENAVYYVNPPERPAIEQKERTPTELYVRKLIYSTLDKKSMNKVLKKLRQLHWEEPEIVTILRKVFIRPGKVKYSHVYLLACLLGLLHRYHSAFVVDTIDSVIESIIVGLENNDFRFSQRRVAEAKFIAELYNYRMLDHPAIFEVMYKILTFGQVRPPAPGIFNEFDPPDDFFRIRLIATILETCGMFFNKGPSGRKLDCFLSFLQYYIFSKDPLPVEVEFLVEDIFSQTRPKWKRATTFEEAAEALQVAILEDQKAAGIESAALGDGELKTPADQDDELSDDSSDDDNADDQDQDAEDDLAQAGSEDTEDAESVATGNSNDEEEIIVTRATREVDPEEISEFDRELAKIMAESTEPKKFERKPVIDIPLPVRPKTRDTSGIAENDKPQASEGKVAFALLTKKGTKQQTRTVEFPADSSFAVVLRDRRQAEKEEHQRIKDLVLRYDRGEKEDQDDGDETSRPQPLAPNANIHNKSVAAGRDGRSHNRIGVDSNANHKANRDHAPRARRLEMSDFADWYGNNPQTQVNKTCARRKKGAVTGAYGAGKPAANSERLPVAEARYGIETASEFAHPDDPPGHQGAWRGPSTRGGKPRSRNYEGRRTQRHGESDSAAKSKH